MKSTFNGCQNLIHIFLQNFNTSLVKDISNMFSDCYNLTILDLSVFDTSQVEDT